MIRPIKDNVERTAKDLDEIRQALHEKGALSIGTPSDQLADLIRQLGSTEDGPSPETETEEWIYPSDWVELPPMPEENGAYLIVKVEPESDNFIAFLPAARNEANVVTVDWGDGTISSSEDYWRGISHTYDYNSIDSPISSEGFKTVLIEVKTEQKDLRMLDLSYAGEVIIPNEPRITPLLAVRANLYIDGQSLVLGSSVTIDHMRQINSNVKYVDMKIDQDLLENYEDNRFPAEAGGMFSECHSLEHINFSQPLIFWNASNMFRNCHSLKKLPLLNYKSFDWGDKFAINCDLDREELLKLFNEVREAYLSPLDIWGNPGIEELTSQDIAIIEEKGWKLGLEDPLKTKNGSLVTWQYPNDWVPEPTPIATQGFNCVISLAEGLPIYAIHCVTSDGQYQVDWGDGNVTTHDSETLAEYTYDWSSLNSPITNNNLKTVVVTITSVLPNSLSAVNFHYSHSRDTRTSTYSSSSLLYVSGNCTGVKTMAFSPMTTAKTFWRNRALQFVSLRNFDSITNASSLFKDCSALKMAVLQGTSEMINASSMFYNCYALETAILSDTPELTGTNSMFYGCYNLKSVTLKNTSKVTSMFDMFSNCCSLEHMSFNDTSSVTNMGSMFRYCYNLRSVTIPSLSKVTSLSNMFSNCYLLSSIKTNDTVWGTPSASTTEFINFTSLSREEIVKIFNLLPTRISTSSIMLTDVLGAADLTDEDKAIATSKNWTLVL